MSFDIYAILFLLSVIQKVIWFVCVCVCGLTFVVD